MTGSEVTQSESSGRRPKLVHAFILLFLSSLSVLVTAILGPTLPQMQEHFKDAPNADYLVPLTMTAPMLMMAVFSIGAGALSDRIGRKAMLVWAALFYGLVGTAPIYLDSIYTILGSRIGLGILEAVLMTVSTAMIGDYWHGAQRERYMALQTTVASASAFLLNNLGGMIGEYGWRAPYAVYAISILLAPLMLFFLWEPTRTAHNEKVATRPDDPVFRPWLIAFTCVMAVVTGIVFMVVPVHFGYLHASLGVQSPSQIGAAFGINSLGVIIGTLTFGWALSGRVRVGWQVALAFVVTGLAFIAMRYAHDYTTLTAAGFLNGVGAGLLLPTMVTWNMRNLPFAKRGLGTGAFQSSLFLGMFLNPFLVVWLEHVLGARVEAVAAIGAALLALTAVSAVIGAFSARGEESPRVAAT